MLSSQTTVLLIIVAEVLSFLILLGLLVVLYRILIVRYKEKKASTPRDIGTLIHITLINRELMYVCTNTSQKHPQFQLQELRHQHYP